MFALAALAAKGASFAQVTISGNLTAVYRQSTTAIGKANSAASLNQIVTQANRSGFGVNTEEINLSAKEDLGGGQSVEAKLGPENVYRGATQSPASSNAQSFATLGFGQQVKTKPQRVSFGSFSSLCWFKSSLPKVVIQNKLELRARVLLYPKLKEVWIERYYLLQADTRFTRKLTAVNKRCSIMLNAIIHYENANFLRELAENPPSKKATNCKTEQIEFLHRLANDEIAERKADANHRVFNTPVPTCFCRQALEQRLVALEQFFQGVQKKTFTKAAGAGEKIILAMFY